MVTKTYICDKCKKSVGENELIPITATINLPARSGSNYRRNTSCTKELCKDCLTKQGIIVEISEKEREDATQVKNEKTLESKIVDFLVDLGVVFEE